MYVKCLHLASFFFCLPDFVLSVPKPKILCWSSCDGSTFKKLMRHCTDRQAYGLQNRCSVRPYSENTHLRWDLNSDEHKYIFFPLVKSGFKPSLPVTKETTLGKSMKVMSLKREGIPQLSRLPPNNLCLTMWVCLCVSGPLSLSVRLSPSVSFSMPSPTHPLPLSLSAASPSLTPSFPLTTLASWQPLPKD